MASNTLTNVMPKILATGLLALREQAIMPRLVNPDYGDEAAQKGATIDIPISAAATATDVTPAPARASAAAKAPGVVSITMDNWKHSDFYLTDKEMTQIDANAHFFPMQASEAIRALANAVNSEIHANYKYVYGWVGTAGVTPFSTTKTATEVRRVLNTQLAPINDRRGVLGPDAEGQALQLQAFSDLQTTGDPAVKIEGTIGRKFGVDWYMDQNVAKHTKGTLVSALVASVAAVGASTFKLKSVSPTGPGNAVLKIGDVFTLANDTQTYVSLTSAAIVSAAAGTAVRFDPPLKVLASSQKVAIKGSHTVNLAFHRNAIAFANRPLQDGPAGLGTQIVAATDDVSGISLRLEVSRQYKQVTWDFDLLWGSKLVRPPFATRIAG